jgi:hypothetical protein
MHLQMFNFVRVSDGGTLPVGPIEKWGSRCITVRFEYLVGLVGGQLLLRTGDLSRRPCDQTPFLCKPILDDAQTRVCPHVDSLAVCLRKDRYP